MALLFYRAAVYPASHLYLLLIRFSNRKFRARSFFCKGLVREKASFRKIGLAPPNREKVSTKLAVSYRLRNKLEECWLIFSLGFNFGGLCATAAIWNEIRNF